MSKNTRKALKNDPESIVTDLVDAASPVMIIGDKSKAQLSRQIANNIRLTFNQIGRDIPTFADAAGVADLVIKSGIKYDSVVIVYNKFVSSISYEAAVMEVKGADALNESSACISLFISLHALIHYT